MSINQWCLDFKKQPEKMLTEAFYAGVISDFEFSDGLIEAFSPRIDELLECFSLAATFLLKRFRTYGKIDSTECHSLAQLFIALEKLDVPGTRDFLVKNASGTFDWLKRVAPIKENPGNATLHKAYLGALNRVQRDFQLVNFWTTHVDDNTSIISQMAIEGIIGVGKRTCDKLPLHFVPLPWFEAAIRTQDNAAFKNRIANLELLDSSARSFFIETFRDSYRSELIAGLSKAAYEWLEAIEADSTSPNSPKFAGGKLKDSVENLPSSTSWSAAVLSQTAATLTHTFRWVATSFRVVDEHECVVKWLKRAGYKEEEKIISPVEARPAFSRRSLGTTN